MKDGILTTLGISSALAAVAVGTYMFRTRSGEPSILKEGRHDDTIIPIITPTITMQVAEDVLAQLDQIDGDKVTLVLHTDGGMVTACVLISNALRRFSQSVAVVPYMALSGGTLIALNASRLMLGRSAALSAVDPQICGARARHIVEKGIAEEAKEYEGAISEYLQETLRARITGPIDRAKAMFLGIGRPHAWPITLPEAVGLGLPVTTAGPEWARLVDRVRTTSLANEPDVHFHFLPTGKLGRR